MEFLSEAWLAELARLGSELPEIADVNLVIQHEIAGAPSGNVRFYTVLETGRYVDVSLGKNPDASVQVAAKVEAALRILAGDLNPDVGFMQGRLKVDGDYKRLLVDYRSYRQSDAYVAMWQQMAELTD